MERVINKNPKKAVFLDRDGVINQDFGYVCAQENFIFIEDTITFLKAVPSEYLVIIITNQSGIARGYYTLEQYLKFQKFVEDQLDLRGVNVTKTYFCPYHPEFKCSGAFNKYINDRKPNDGMIQKARLEFNIDLKNSILIGDNLSDMEAGKKSGIKNLFLLQNFLAQSSDWYKKISSATEISL